VNGQTLNEANASVREAEERRVALDDALRALDQQITEVTARLADAKDKVEREPVAQALEHEALKIEEAGHTLPLPSFSDTYETFWEPSPACTAAEAYATRSATY